MPNRKRPRGRPPQHEIEPIPDSFENVLRAVLAPLPDVLPPMDREEDDEPEEEDRAEAE